MKPTHYIIIGLALVIVLMLLFDSDEPDHDTTQWKEALAKKDIQVQAANDKFNREHEKRITDSLASIKSKEVHESKVKVLNATVAKLRANPKVIEIVKENPEIDSLLQAYDSLGKQKDERIVQLEGELASSQNGHIATEEAFKEAVLGYQGKEDLLVSENDRLRRELNKKDKANTGWKILTVGGTIGGFLLGSQL